MNELGLSGIRFIPERFTPTASVFKGEECGGVRMIVTDRETLRPVQLGLALGHALHRLHPQDFSLEKFNRLLLDQPSIDSLKEGRSWQDIEKPWNDASAAFATRRQSFLLY